jgi:hypothetical protein
MQETLCLGLGHLQGRMSKLSKEADCTLEHFMTSEFNSFSIGLSSFPKRAREQQSR